MVMLQESCPDVEVLKYIWLHLYQEYDFLKFNDFQTILAAAKKFLCPYSPDFYTFQVTCLYALFTTQSHILMSDKYKSFFSKTKKIGHNYIGKVQKMFVLCSNSSMHHGIWNISAKKLKI